jgi:WD40 repeat protein
VPAVKKAKKTKPAKLPDRAPRTELRSLWKADAGDYVTCLSIGADGSVVAAGTGGGEVRAFEADTGALRWSRRPHPQGVLAVAWNPARGVLATSGQDGCAHLLDIADGQRLRELPSPGGWVEHLAWAPGGDRLATSSGRVVRVWTADGEPVLETPPHASTVAGLAWSTDGTQLATCCYGGVHVWTVGAGAEPRHLAWKGSLISLAWSPDDRVIACGSQDCSVHFWRLSLGTDAEMTGYPSKSRALGWDAQGSMLATGGDATVTVWDFAGKGPEGTTPLQLRGHKALLTQLAFAPKKGLLASGSEDCGVLLWEPRKGPRPLGSAFLDEAVTCLAWHPAQGALFGADSKGTLAAWAVP